MPIEPFIPDAALRLATSAFDSTLIDRQTPQQLLSMSIRIKLFLGFGGAIAILALQIFIVTGSIKDMQRAVTDAQNASHATTANASAREILLAELEPQLELLRTSGDAKSRAKVGAAWSMLVEKISLVYFYVDSTSLQEKEVEKLRTLVASAQDDFAALSEAGVDEVPVKAAAMLTSVRILDQQLSHLNSRLRAALESAVAREQSIHNRPVTQAQGLGFLALAFLGIFAIIFSNDLTRQLTDLVRVIESVAGGDLSQRATVTGSDDVDRLGYALNHTIDNLKASIGTISDSSGRLAAASDSLAELSTKLHAGSVDSARQSILASEASEKVTANTQGIAASVEQMSASIKEISQQAVAAAQVASDAVREVSETNDTMLKLDESSTGIAQITRTINNIAEQTNLLALNATIEAARAGDAGRGFAVVAGEVKELSRETSQATDDITHQVGSIQSDIDNAVAAIGRIDTIITRIADIQNAIAGAVEEQSVTTSEITRHISEAATSSASIATAITEVAQIAETTSASAEGSQNAAAELARHAADLKTQVEKFKA
jgi:methyl-accepting chemotaxis protein